MLESTEIAITSLNFKIVLIIEINSNKWNAQPFGTQFALFKKKVWKEKKTFFFHITKLNLWMIFALKCTNIMHLI